MIVPLSPSQESDSTGSKQEIRNPKRLKLSIFYVTKYIRKKNVSWI